VIASNFVWVVVCVCVCTCVCVCVRYVCMCVGTCVCITCACALVRMLICIGFTQIDYRVAKTHRMSYLYSPFSSKEPYD